VPSVRVFKYVNDVNHIRYRTVVLIATPKAIMFTYAQFGRVIQIVEELQRMGESMSFTDKLPWTLVSYVMVFYVLRFVCRSRWHYNRLIVAQRENRRMRHEIEYMRGLPIGLPQNAAPLHVLQGIPIGPPQNQNGLLEIDNGLPPVPVPVAMPVAAQGVVHGLVGQQIQRRSLRKALEHSQKLTKSLKQDLDQLNELESNHKAHGKTLEAQHAAAITVLTNGHKLRMSESKKEHNEELHALQAGHALAHLNPTSAQLLEQTRELHKLHVTQSSADGVAQVEFDTEMSELKVTHKKEASDLSSRQSATKRRFEDKCLADHSRTVRARY